ncbi:MAG: hypothetical protein HY360_06860 [Verrucomicrobia bacterium]|nr:hypothetical protein [Verrucomicrobiota bacterium]
MTAKELQSFFAQPYDRAAWLGNLRTVFPRTDLFAQPQSFSVGDSRAESVCQLGNTHLGNDR